MTNNKILDLRDLEKNNLPTKGRNQKNITEQKNTEQTAINLLIHNWKILLRKFSYESQVNLTE